MIVHHTRLAEWADSTFGTWVTPGGLHLVTVELPWRGDQHDVSCFPDGDHECWRAWSHRHQRDVYHVGVPERPGTEIDIANWASELRGCTALGRHVARFDGLGPDRTWGITHSGSSNRLFDREMRGRPFTLRTRSIYR